ncbi:hypothetical protein LPB140_07845 [Sphingorhabdus lutea]|uniref:Fatty acid hydroxylase domain-containing protein n=2 Tax=Sphingorhabdus lutea TaxID=1913578 RepID=A0A1L3JC95_9SPHN|nr:hypothetical protein LPB140_07845 [Sphingorhabdus lutea]
MKDNIVEWYKSTQGIYNKLFLAFPPGIIFQVILVAATFSFAAMIIEILFIGWLKSSLRKLLKPNVTARIDILTFLIMNSSISSLLGLILSIGLFEYLQGKISAILPSDLGFNTHPILHALLFLIIIDFMDYWIHRLSHESKILWNLHQFHHAAKEMTVITSHRNHPMEVAIHAAKHALIASLLGLPIIEFTSILVLRSVLAGLKHSQLQWKWNWFGKWVLQSPHLHWVHHSTDPAHYNSNYATLFSTWDALFGTYCSPKQDIKNIGLVNERLNSRGFIYDIWICYWGFLHDCAWAVYQFPQKIYSQTFPKK